MTIRPSLEYEGIVFCREDLRGRPRIRALVENVKLTDRGTTLSERKTSVMSVEHVLSALWGCGIDNAIVMLDNEEPPCMDGSAKPLVDEILEVGLFEFENKPVNYLEVEREIKVTGENGSYVKALPHRYPMFTYHIVFQQPIGPQIVSASGLDYIQRIAGARTFASVKDVQLQRSRGLSQASTPQNALMHENGNWITESLPLRYHDEPCRHKVLDLIGDLALAGVRLRGHTYAYKAGHELHTQFANLVRKKYLLRDKQLNTPGTY
jgi:UDP-3-O-acyl N-acetylglucosamine deacetylase